MPSLVIDNTVQVRLIWGLASGPFAVNVLHGIKDTGFLTPNQDSVDAMKTRLATAWSSSTLKPFIGNTVSLQQIGLRDLNAPNYPEIVSTLSGATGTGTTELLPNATSLCVTFRTEKAGKSFRGRMYQWGYVEGSSTGGNCSAGCQAATQAWGESLKQVFADSGLQLAVASRKLGISEPVTGVVVRDTRWDTQRRRNVPGI